MTASNTHNVNVADQRVLMSPAELREQVAVSDPLSQFVAESRQTIEAIIDGKDDRLMVVVGPCSIHDVDAALEVCTPAACTVRPGLRAVVYRDASLFRKTPYHCRLEGLD